jgi:hypothetical protein
MRHDLENNETEFRCSIKRHVLRIMSKNLEQSETQIKGYETQIFEHNKTKFRV